MSEREQVVQIVNRLPDYKIRQVLIFLQGVMFDDEMEDDYFCEQLYQKYLDDPDPEKHQTVTLEELAAQEGIEL